MATYSQTLSHILSLAFMLLGGIGLTFAYTDSQAYNTETQTKETNSQNLDILNSRISVRIPDAIGGPADIHINDNALIPQTHVSTTGLVKPIIEDTQGIGIYVVRKGDTLSEIAELFDVTQNTIRWENNLGKTLRVGQELRILPVSGVSHTIKKGDTYGKIAQKYDVEIEDITIFNNLDAKKLTIGKQIIIPNGVKQTVSAVAKKTTSSSSSNQKTSVRSSSTRAEKGYYIRPTSGRTSSTFGPRSGSYHYGIDYAVAIGTPVVASASGVVTKTSCGRGYGICTVIQHDNGTQTLYAHNSKLFVSIGSKVKQGQKIANSGNTGRSTGPHLHFEIQDSRTGAKKNPNFLK